MRGFVRVLVVLCCIAAVSPLLAQVGNSTLTGIVEDATQARIIGVNESGSYNIPNLTPGAYTLRASLPGFRPHVFERNVAPGANKTGHSNFALQVAATQITVEVWVEAQQLLTHSVRLVVL